MIANSERTPEERKEIARRGGIASGKARRRKRSMKEAADLYLSLPVADKRRFNRAARRYVDAEDIDNQMLMIIGLVDAATDGDARAAKVIIDLVGGMDADKTEDNDKNGVIEIPAVNLSEFEQLKEQEMLVSQKNAAGGGKSDALLMEGLRQIGNKNYKGIIFRRTYQQLEELIDKSNRFIGAAVPGARYNASAHTWTFPSGAKLLLRQMERDADRYKYQGHEYQYIGFDELTHFSFAQYSYLMSRCRSADPTLRCYVRASTNPGGVGHGWVKDRFIDSMKPYERKWDLIRVGDIKMLRSRMFIPATIFDNKKLLESDPEYLANLGALPEADRRALLYGDWNSFEGQVFREFKDDPAHYDDHRWTHVINEFEIPQDWKIMRAYDFGYSKPFSVGWYAINHDGTIFRIAELYGCNGTPNVGLQWDAGRQAREIAETEATLPNLKDRVITGVADPAIFEESHGESIAEIMRREGILFEPGDHQRIAGKMQIHSRLAFDANGRAGT